MLKAVGRCYCKRDSKEFKKPCRVINPYLLWSLWLAGKETTAVNYCKYNHRGDHLDTNTRTSRITSEAVISNIRL